MIEFRTIDVTSAGEMIYQCEACGSMTTDIQLHIDWHNKIFNQMRYVVPVGKTIEHDTQIFWTLQELIDQGVITSRRILRKEP